MVDTITKDDKDRPRPLSIKVEGPPAGCANPVITLQPTPLQSVKSGTSATLSVGANAPNLTFQWYDGGVLIPNATGFIFTTDNLTATHIFTVRVTASCGTTTLSTTAEVDIQADTCTPALAILTPPVGTTVGLNQSAILDITALGHNVQYRWGDACCGFAGSSWSPISTYHTLPMQVSSTFQVQLKSDCSGTILTSDPVPVIVALPAPGNLTATASTSLTSVHVSWTPLSTYAIGGYQLERKNDGGAWAPVANSPLASGTSSYEDIGGVLPGHAYAYRIRGFDSSQGHYAGTYSNIDVATALAISSPAVAGQHLTVAPLESIRNAVNAVRSISGLSVLTWDDLVAAGDKPAGPGAPVRASQITALRLALDHALSIAGVAVGPYTDSVLSAVRPKAVHINELWSRTQ